MHLDLPHLLYSGPPVDDIDALDRVPPELAAALRHRNGCVAFMGGLHVRGASQAPAWHALRGAWEGGDALHTLYDEVQPSDVPFAEDAFGDQFLVRDGRVVRLSGELGEMMEVAGSLEEFFSSLLRDAEAVLDYEPLLRHRDEGRELQPGELLAAYPPFVLKADRAARQLRAEDALERRRVLAALARRLHGLPDGAEIRLDSSA